MHAVNTTRINSIDFLRGLVMVIMTVGHTRYFFSSVSLSNPMNLVSIDTATFFTRWLGYFASPAFVFLAGLSVYMYAQRRRVSRLDLSNFLLKRGLLLILLEVTLIRFGWTFTFLTEKIFLQVIFATGFSMICLAGLIWLPWRALMAVAIIIITGHNLFDAVSFTEGTLAYGLWALLHDPHSIVPIGDIAVYVSYPVLPWIGVMALGYGCGRLFLSDKRGRFLVLAGVAMSVAFVVLRLWGVYGDASPWHIYEGQPMMTLMSFLNLTKYPPSLLFILMALGGNFLLLHAAERWKGWWYDTIVTFGRVPLFYYVLHIYVLHLVYRISSLMLGSRPDIHSIEAIWGVSLLFLIVLYPITAYFARLKAQKRSPILSYF